MTSNKKNVDNINDDTNIIRANDKIYNDNLNNKIDNYEKICKKGFNFYKKECFIESAICFYILLQKYKCNKYKYIIKIIQKQLFLQTNYHFVYTLHKIDIKFNNSKDDSFIQGCLNKKNVLYDDSFDSSKPNIKINWMFDSKIDIVDIKKYCDEDVLVDTEEFVIKSGEKYGIILEKFKKHCIENTNYDLINYFEQKQMVFYVNKVKEWKFIYESIIYEINVYLNKRAMEYLKYYKEEMKIEGMLKMYK